MLSDTPNSLSHSPLSQSSSSFQTGLPSSVGSPGKTLYSMFQLSSSAPQPTSSASMRLPCTSTPAVNTATPRGSVGPYGSPRTSSTSAEAFASAGSTHGNPSFRFQNVFFLIGSR